MYQKIKTALVNWLKSHHLMLSKDQLVLDNWNVLPYKQAIYNVIAVANGTWRVEVNLFLEVTGNATTDKVIAIPTELVFSHPELAFVYLQSMGPMFSNTTVYVLIVDNINGIIMEWDLTKRVQDQPGVNIAVFGEDVQRAMAGPTTAASDSSKMIKRPTHTGPITIN